MKSHPIAAHRANEAIDLRYNLFRHKWRPGLCCAVPESDPVPSFVTGEQWDFGGTWEGAISSPGLKPTAAEPGCASTAFICSKDLGLARDWRCPNIQRQADRGESLRGEGFELRLDDRRGLLLS